MLYVLQELQVGLVITAAVDSGKQEDLQAKIGYVKKPYTPARFSNIPALSLSISIAIFIIIVSI